MPEDRDAPLSPAATRVIGRGDGVARYTARGSVMWFKALAEQDGGDLSVMERTLPPRGRRPPAHRHTNCSEAYFVLEQEAFVLVPRGAAHTFGNAGAVEARVLVIHAPAMDAYFAELHGLWNREVPPSPDEERALMARFGMVPAS
jgi:mannose-6-phosphate isomerase-like protein (cupin superfamily)